MGSDDTSLVRGIGMLGKRITDLLGIRYPIIQGGMAWIADAQLAAAVSNAGGLGIIAAGHMQPEELRKEIYKVKNLTDKPWGLNVYFLSPHLDEIIDMVIEEKVPVITTGAGNPGKYINRLKKNGTKVIPVVASVALARRLERSGVDAIIAEGMECGGHIGEITTMALVPQVVDAVSIPVVAAGGIADGRGMLASFALGAEGVQLGTLFICSDECRVHPKYKAAIIKAKDRSTVITGTSMGHPVRVIRNKLTKEMERLEALKADPDEIGRIGSGKLKLAAIDGDVDHGSLMAGQIAAMVDKVRPMDEIIKMLVEGMAATLNDLCKLS